MSHQVGGAVAGRGSPNPPAAVMLFLSVFWHQKKAKEKQSPERISSVLTVDDPHGSCMLKPSRAGPAVSEPRGGGGTEKHERG